jgi:predicted transcriptional regulator
MSHINSDDAQERINDNQRKISGLNTDNSLEKQKFVGAISTETEDLDMGNPFDERLNEEYEALDLIYSSLRKTNGNSRLEGLETFPETPEGITEQTYNRHWKPAYREGGLVNDGELTKRGEKFVDEGLDWYLLDLTWLDGIDEVYDLLTTGSKNQDRGSKIQAFEMYGNGEDSHTEVEKETGLNSSTARTLANELEDIGLLEKDDGSYGFTRPGNKLEGRIQSHLDYLEDEVTRGKIMPKKIETPDSLVDELMDKAYRKASD